MEMSESEVVSASASASAEEGDKLHSPSQGTVFNALLVAVHSALSLVY